MRPGCGACWLWLQSPADFRECQSGGAGGVEKPLCVPKKPATLRQSKGGLTGLLGRDGPSQRSAKDSLRQHTSSTFSFTMATSTTGGTSLCSVESHFGKRPYGCLVLWGLPKIPGLWRLRLAWATYTPHLRNQATTTRGLP